MMEYCSTCKINVEGVCTANYKNPTKDLESAIAQAKNKGEWPCTFSPHRATFIDFYRPFLKNNILQKIIASK